MRAKSRRTFARRYSVQSRFPSGVWIDSRNGAGLCQAAPTRRRYSSCNFCNGRGSRWLSRCCPIWSPRSSSARAVAVVPERCAPTISRGARCRSFIRAWLGGVTEARVQMFQRVRRERLVLRRQIISIAADFAAPYFERLRITHVARAQDFGIEHAGCFQSLHVGEIREFERVFERFRVGRIFAERREQNAEVLLGRSAERFVVKEREILPLSEFREPVIHCLDDRHDSVAPVPQEVADIFFFYALRRFGCAMDHLHVKRDKSVAGIAHQQDDSGPSKFSRGHEILPTNPVPQSAFHPLLGEVVRKN